MERFGAAAPLALRRANQRMLYKASMQYYGD
jgi:hypothetical protein